MKIRASNKDAGAKRGGKQIHAYNQGIVGLNHNLEEHLKNQKISPSWVKKVFSRIYKTC